MGEAMRALRLEISKKSVHAILNGNTGISTWASPAADSIQQYASPRHFAWERCRSKVVMSYLGKVEMSY